MKYKLVDGKLVPATEDDVKAGIELFDLEDKQEDPTPVEAPALKLTSAVEELTGLIKELAQERAKDDKNIENEIKEEKEKLEAVLRSVKELEKKGLVLPKNLTDPDDSKIIDPYAKLFDQYDLSQQGRALVDKAIRGNKYTMPEEKREDFAKMMLFFIRGWLQNDAMVKANYRDFVRDIEGKYNVKTESSTALGMTANDFPVPTPLEAEILAFARENSVVLRNCRVWPMTSETKTIPVESSGVSVSWGRTTSESNPTETDFTLTSYVLSAFSTINQELLEDTISDVVGWIAELMSEAIGLELDNVAFNGDGTDSYAGCSGLLTAACGYSVVMGSGDTSFSDMDDGDLSEMIAKLDGKKKEGAKFYMHGEILHVVRTIKDSNGTPIFYPGYVGTNDPPAIFGYPYEEVIKMPSTSAANTAFVVFGNLKYFAVGRRIANMRLSVDPYGKWEENQVRYKIRNRWALGIALANGFVRLLTAAS